MSEISEMLYKYRANPDAVEGLATEFSKPYQAELCSLAVKGSKVVYQCVYVNKIKDDKYFCRLERVGW